MSNKRLLSAFQALPGLARRVFDAVPIEAAWNTVQVSAEMQRLGYSVPVKDIMTGCLDTLKDTGLIREVGRGNFQRVYVPPLPGVKPKITVDRSTYTAEPEDDMPQTTKADPLTSMGEVAASLRAMAAQLLERAKEIENAALEMEQRVSLEGEASRKLAALREALK